MWDMKGIDLRRSVYADDYELLEQMDREMIEREDREYEAYLKQVEQEQEVKDKPVRPRRMPDVSSLDMGDEDLDLDLE